MKRVFTFSAFVLALSLAACGDAENNDDRVQTKDISRDGAIETVVTTEHLNDTIDVLITTHKIWKDNAVVKETAYRDTIPALGTMMSEVKEENGDEKNAMVKKDYEFYITVK